MRRLEDQDRVCVCASALLLFSAFPSPVALGHNARSALTFYDATVYAAWDIGLHLFDYHCGDGYNPISPVVIPHGCVGACTANGLAHSTTCLSPLRAVSIVSGPQVTFNLDCHRAFAAPDFPGNVKAKVTSGSGQTTAAECNTSWAVDAQVGFHMYAEDLHWSRTHGLLSPAAVSEQLSLRQEALGTDYETTLNVQHLWLYTAGVIPLVSAFLQDADEDTEYLSNDALAHFWNMSDPGGDDRLWQGGLDVTPPVGGSRTLEPGVTITREDAGSGDVVWRLTSTLTAKYLVVSKARDEVGTRVWNIYAVVV